MNALRARMIEDLQLHGLSKSTQALYVRAVQKLAEHYQRPPDQITEEELRRYFLYLTNAKRVSPSTLRIALCGIKFFYERTLRRQWTVLELVRPPTEKKLPVVLTIDEVRQILACVNHLRFRACLGTIYACGLRIREGVHLQVKDIEAREVAKIAGVPESNFLYQAVEKLKVLETQRTWQFTGSALGAKDLSLFLDKINLRISHHQPKISPCKNSIAHVTAELYDAKILSFSDLAFFESLFRDYDPTLFLIETKSRPDLIKRMGGFAHESTYLDLPKDWGQTLDTSLPLLESRSEDGRIVLGEWTHLKRLQDNWPTEERISLFRATPPYELWSRQNLGQDELPFASKIGLYTSDYLQIMDFPEKDLVIAHKGYRYRMEVANWLGLNPRVGLDLGWKPIDKKWFSWKDKNDKLVVESIYWQDGNFESYSWFDHVEVGYGWIVLITVDGFKELRRRYGVISRGGVIKRSLGQFGSKSRNSISSILDIN